MRFRAVLHEPLMDLARGEIEAAGLRDWDFRIEYADDAVCGRLGCHSLRLLLYRGIGKGIEFHQRVFEISDRLIVDREFGHILELFRDDVRFLCWSTKLKNGLAVGKAGKLRLFKRSTAIAVKAAA